MPCGFLFWISSPNILQHSTPSCRHEFGVISCTRQRDLNDGLLSTGETISCRLANVWNYHSCYICRLKVKQNKCPCRLFADIDTVRTDIDLCCPCLVLKSLTCCSSPHRLSSFRVYRHYIRRTRIFEQREYYTGQISRKFRDIYRYFESTTQRMSAR